MPRSRDTPPDAFPIIDSDTPGFIEYRCQHDGYEWRGERMVYVVCPRCSGLTRRSDARRLARGEQVVIRLADSSGVTLPCREPTCPRRGAPFVTSRSDTHYCSVSCRMRAYRRRAKAANSQRSPISPR